MFASLTGYRLPSEKYAYMTFEMQQKTTLDAIMGITEKIRDLAQIVGWPGLRDKMQQSSIIVVAERRAGEMLKEMPKNPGIQMLGSNIVQPPIDIPRLEELGISKMGGFTE